MATIIQNVMHLNNVQEELSFYWMYHSHPINQCIHFLFVPAIVWTIAIWTAPRTSPHPHQFPLSSYPSSEPRNNLGFSRCAGLSKDWHHRRCLVSACNISTLRISLVAAGERPASCWAQVLGWDRKVISVDVPSTCGELGNSNFRSRSFWTWSTSFSGFLRPGLHDCSSFCLLRRLVGSRNQYESETTHTRKRCHSNKGNLHAWSSPVCVRENVMSRAQPQLFIMPSPLSWCSVRKISIFRGSRECWSEGQLTSTKCQNLPGQFNFYGRGAHKYWCSFMDYL